MICVDYSKDELEIIRFMSREGRTDEQICQVVYDQFKVKRTPKSMARKRGREGITKLSIQPYLPRVGWSRLDVEFVRDHYRDMTDAEIGLTLNRSESAVLRIRSKYFFARTECGHRRVDPPIQHEEPYQKHYIYGGMSDYEKHYIEHLKATKGTYVCPARESLQAKRL